MSHRNLYSLFIVVILAIGLLAIQAPDQARAAGPWYVSTTGDDSNDCLSPGSPCATINGAIGKASSGDTVYVAVGTFTGAGSEVVLIDRDITLSGGWDGGFSSQTGLSTIDGEDSRIGIRLNQATSTVEYFRVQNGFACSGGGIQSLGTLSLTNSEIVNNRADNPCGAGGGGIWSFGALEITNSSIINNVGYQGGGIYISGGTATLDNVLLSANRSTREGGGIYIQGFIGNPPVITVNNSNITKNSAFYDGGGIYLYQSRLTINSSSITKNSTEASQFTGGGGIYNYESLLVLNNSTLSNNTTYKGGGIYLTGAGTGSAALNSSTIAYNVAAVGGGIINDGNNTTITLQNSILARNIGNASGPDCIFGPITSGGYNIVGNMAGCNFVSSNGDQIDIDPLIGLLIGEAGYHPLLQTSPAIDMGNPAGCTDQDGIILNNDQRGVARIGACDRGAYEYTVPGPAARLSIAGGSDQLGITTADFAAPLQAAVLDEQGSPVSGVTVDFAAPANGPSGTFADTNTNATSAVTDEGGVATTSTFTANTEPGAYLVTATSTGLGSVEFNLQQITRPVNDDFADAEEILALPFNGSVDSTNATLEPGEPNFCGITPQTQSVWYSFTPDTNMALTADMAGSSFSDTNLIVYQSFGPGFGGLSFLRTACFGGSATFDVQAGATYYIQAQSYSSGGGELHVNLQQVPPPANDNFADAAEIGTLPFTATEDITGATIQPDEPHFCSFMSKTIWYSFTPTNTVTIRAENLAPNGFMNIYRATGSGIVDLEHLQCLGPENFSTLVAEPGQTYYLQVSSFAGGGTVEVSVREAFPPANDSFSNAEDIPSLPFNVTPDLTDVGIEPDEPQACGLNNHTVWYSFTPTETISVRAEAFSNNAFMTMYRANGSGISDLQNLPCISSGTPSVFLLESGVTYYIQVGFAFGTNANIEINLQQVFPPANDLFDSAEEVTSLPFDSTVDVTDARTEPGEQQFCVGMGRTVWYSFMPAETMSVRVTVHGFMNIYRATGDGIANLEHVRCAGFDGLPSTFLAVAGETYYIQAGSDFFGDSTLQISLQQAFPPANDLFDSAEEVTSLPFSATPDLTDTGIEPGEPQICTFLNRTVWYSFTPTETINVRASTQGFMNIYLSTGDGISNLQHIGCLSSGSSTSFLAEAGQVYYLQVGPTGGIGTVQVNLQEAAPPPNDDFSGAEVITSLPFSASPDITDATTEPNEQQFCSFVQRTVWYSFSPTETVKVRANTDGGSVPGNVSIYRGGGSDISDLQFLNCSSAFSSATFTAEAGEQYYVQVGAAFGDVGSVQINLSEVTTISGRVVDAVTGGPLPGNSSPFAFVSLYRICGDNCLEFVNSQQPDGEGRFLFDGYYFGPPLSPGSYQINASATLYELQEFGPFEFTGASLDLGDIRLNPPAVIRGRVVSAQTGEPLPGTSVILYRCNDGGGCFEFVNSAGADGDGRFLFDRFYFGSPLPGGTYELEFSAALHVTTRIQVTIESGEDRDLGDVLVSPLPLIGSIQGRILDNATGKPISPTFTPYVNLYRCFGDSCFEFVASQVPDGAGGFRFETNHSGDPLLAGRYKVIAFADQYQQVETAPFDVGEDVDWSVGNLRLTSLPLRFSDVHSCAEIPSTGSDCVYSVRVWNGGFGTFEGAAWSMVNGSLPETFAGYTDFQARDRTDLNLARGQSKVIQFRFTVPANSSTYGTFLCARLFVTQGGNSLFNTVGLRDLFCVLRNAGGFTLASPQETLSFEQHNVTVASSGTDVEPNNSCQSAQDVGSVSEPFLIDGNLDPSEVLDIDFFRFTATPGQQVSVDHEGQDTGKGTLSDPLLGFFDSNCNLVALNDDSGSLNSQLEITVPGDGVFILAATSYPDFDFTGSSEIKGTYQLTVTPVQPIGSITGRVTDAVTGSPLRGDVSPYAFVRLLQCNQFGCFDVNNQMAGSDGRFSFTTDFYGAPLPVGGYMLVISANQYHNRQTDIFTVGNGENLDLGDVSLTSYPVRFSDIQPCVVPAAGGVCEFSVRITNGLATQLNGKAWSVIAGFGTGSFTNFTFFQDNPLQNVRLDPGQSTVLRFQLRVRESVANGATICAAILVGQGQSAYFNTVGASTLFCVTKGSTSFTLLTEQQTHTRVPQMQVQELIPPNRPVEIRK